MRPTGIATCVLLVSAVAAAQVTVAVDPSADVHPISPFIYGMNFPSSAQVSAGRLTFGRWGGNGTTRYNYRTDVQNTAADYFFENLPSCWNLASAYCSAPPADPQLNSSANAYLTQMSQAGLPTFFTMPVMGWVPKPPPVYGHPFPCGCPVTVVGAQDAVDPYDTNCGNGVHGGNHVACPAATTTSIAVDAGWDGQWAAYLVNQFGASNGKRVYALDNEPNLWSSTHWDAHPQPLSYDEEWLKMQAAAVALLQADPTAQIAAPSEWGWTNYFVSALDLTTNNSIDGGADRAAHGGEELTAWLLDQFRAHEQATGQRLLHYLDLHYYPQGSNAANLAENTRSLWDPTYVDPSWIGAPIQLIPRMHRWVDQHYPGTRISLSEYDWGHHNEAIGAVIYAEVLGIFGREALDAATAWAPPADTETAFAAFKLYRNFDGQGGQFESTSARATVTGGSSVRAYAAVSNTRVTLALVNEAATSSPVVASFGSFLPGATAQWYTQGTGSAIARQPDVTLSGGKASVTLAGTSIGMLVVDGVNPNPLPDGGTDAGGVGDSGQATDAGTGLDGGGLPAADGGGQPAADGGGQPAADGGGSGARGGCGCSGAPASFGAAILLMLFFRRARRNQSPTSP